MKIITIAIAGLLLLATMGCSAKAQKPIDKRYNEQNIANDKAMKELNRY